MNSARRANSATRPYHPIRSKRAFARTNARFVQAALKASSRTSAQTAAARSCPGQSGRRRTGMATTFLAKTPPARGSGTGASIPRHMQSSRPQSRTFQRKGDRERSNVAQWTGVTPRVTRYAKRPSPPQQGEECVRGYAERLSRRPGADDAGIQSTTRVAGQRRRFPRRNVSRDASPARLLLRSAESLDSGRPGGRDVHSDREDAGERWRDRDHPPAKHCYTVARFVLLEDFRREHKQLHLDKTSWSSVVTTTSARSLEPAGSIEIQEQRLECLERRLQELSPEQRALVIEYYRDARGQRIERRREMAKRLGITMNALSIRVSRIRAALEASVESCRKQERQVRPAIALGRAIST